MSDDQSVHVARFEDVVPEEALFIDTAIPGHSRRIWSIIGRNVGENRGVTPVIPADGFHLAIIESEPGNGSALHTHTTVEVFMPLSGRWQITHGVEGEHEVILGPRDVCSVPPGVWRGFRNVGDETAQMIALVGGTDAGRLTWAPHIRAEAERLGQRLDAEGFMPS